MYIINIYVYIIKSCSQLYVQQVINVDTHPYPYEIMDPKYRHINAILQFALAVFKEFDFNLHFNSNTEGS